MNVLEQLQQDLNSIFGYRRTTRRKAVAVDRAIKAERNKSYAALRKARELAAKHGIEIEKEDSNAFWVTHPSLTDTDTDPLEGNHFCSDGQEVLAAVEAYVEHLAKGA